MLRRNPIRIGLFAVVSMCWGISAHAANYPLEIINIRAGMNPNSRIMRAYPGLEYNIRAAVIGGAYPYTYALTNAPAGMTIDTQTGLIIWPNPTGNANPTLTVVDAEGTRVSSSWAISVTTAGFRFVDGVNGRNALGNGCSSSCGTGSASNPWRTISDMYYNASATDFVYFRNGTYRVTDLPRTGAGGAWERVDFDSDQHPSVWLAYPGQVPLIDFAYQAGVENGPMIRVDGDTVYFDGFETTRSRYIALQYTGGTGPTFRRMRMHTSGPGLDGSNSAFILTNRHSPITNYMVVQDSTFFDIAYGTGNCALKIYSQSKILIENNSFYDTDDGSEAVVALKEDIRQFTVRGNSFNVPGKAIGGNMSSLDNAETRTTSGEILFNNVRAGQYALDLNQNSQVANAWIYRNTLIGRVQMRSVDLSDGPFVFSRNVIINGDAGTPSGSHIYHSAVSAPSRITLIENLVGYPQDNIVDMNGNLTPAYATYIGVRGHTTGPTVPSPNPPGNLRIIR